MSGAELDAIGPSIRDNTVVVELPRSVRTRAERKILPILRLGSIAQEYRANGRTVVLAHGTFDLLHIGHVRHLQAARRHGDVLFVTITADAFVNKGPGRPVFAEGLRSEMLASL